LSDAPAPSPFDTDPGNGPADGPADSSADGSTESPSHDDLGFSPDVSPELGTTPSRNAGHAQCPATAEIERLALDGLASLEVSAHVAGCRNCSQRLQRSRDDAMFLSRVKHLATDGLGPGGTPRIPGYRELTILSSGTQGVVYKGVQESTQRQVAIKTLLSGRGATMKQRLRAEREAEIVASLRHPNIVTVFESRTLWDGQIAVVMEFVDGVPLDEWQPAGATRQDRLREQLRVFAQVCHAVHHAHLNGVIHRDLKPDNILVTKDTRPVVLDFGIAKAGTVAGLARANEGSGVGIGRATGARTRSGRQATITGDFAGTPAYASPEQVSGKSGTVDALTDVYSLGVMLYRLLTGSFPYELEGSIFEMARVIREQSPTRPRARDGTIPQEVESIILQAMQKEKSLRYQSAGAIARDLERFLKGEPVEAMSAVGWYLVRKALHANRKPILLGLVALSVLLAAGGAVVLSASRANAAAAREAAQRERTAEEAARARAVTELLRETIPTPTPSSMRLATVSGSGLGRLYLRLETGEFADDPAMDQTLRRLWGQVYTGFGGRKATGLIAYSEVSLRSGLERLRVHYGQEHVEIGETLHNLASVVLLRRRPAEAEPMARQALAMREKLLGKDHIATAETRGLLARVLLELGQQEEAEDQARTALADFANSPAGEADLPIAAIESMLARSKMGDQRWTEAESLVRSSLSRRVRRLPVEDPEFITSLEDLALLAEGAPECGLVRIVAPIWEDQVENQIVPKTSQALDASLTLAARIRADIPTLARPDEGTVYMVVQLGRTDALGRIVALQELLLGDKDVTLVRTLMARMIAAGAEQNIETKVAVTLRAASILEHHFGKDHPSTVVCLEEAAMSNYFLGRFDQAVEIQRKACAIRELIPIEARDPMMLANGMRYIAHFLACDGRHAEALPVYEDAIRRLVASVGEKHHLVTICRSLQAWTLWNLGEQERADALSRLALEDSISNPAMSVDQLQQSRFVRARILLRKGEPAEAKELLEQAWSVTYKFYPTNHMLRREFIADATRASELVNDKERAAWWASQLETDPTTAPDASHELR